jgi:hypothetical protein
VVAEVNRSSKTVTITSRYSPTVKEMRAAGYKLRVKHFRIPQYDPDSHKVRLSPRGGFTEVTMTTPDGRHFTRTAVCRPEDAFCRKEGVYRALERCRYEAETCCKDFSESEKKNILKDLECLI